jgi:hypothetical protein
MQNKYLLLLNKIIYDHQMEKLAVKISLAQKEPEFKKILDDLVLKNGNFSKEKLEEAIKYCESKGNEIIKELYCSS